MNNSKLVHYLNEGVRVKHYDAERDRNCILDIQYWNKDEVVCTNSDNEYVLPIKDITLYLYPLSCLTEEIPFKGKMVVPLVELAKVEGSYKCEKCTINNDSILWVDGNYGVHLFSYDFTNHSFKNVTHYSIHYVINQLSLFLLLLKMRINIFPDEIDSIDPRTELINPYTI